LSFERVNVTATFLPPAYVQWVQTLSEGTTAQSNMTPESASAKLQMVLLVERVVVRRVGAAMQ
jgi:hypothetical protein